MEMKDLPIINPNGAIPPALLKTIRDIYKKDAQDAGELAISFIEYYLCEQTSTPNKANNALIENILITSGRTKIRK